MELPETILRIFYIAVIVSVLLSLVESFAMLFSSFFFFRTGIKVKTIHGIHVNLDKLEIGKGYTTTHARFTRVSENSCFFYHRHGFFRINTPFSIKGEIRRDESGFLLIWRIPLGSALFFSLWLLGWISPLFGIFQLTTREVFSKEFAVSILAILFGVFWIWLLYFFSTKLEQKRARLALSELLFFSLHQ